jgi:hypothetical protein
MDDLEQIIAELVERKNALKLGSAEHSMLLRVLNGLRYSYEDAGPIWESLDPFGWRASLP